MSALQMNIDLLKAVFSSRQEYQFKIVKCIRQKMNKYHRNIIENNTDILSIFYTVPCTFESKTIGTTEI